jgi:hypothetical protein
MFYIKVVLYFIDYPPIPTGPGAGILPTTNGLICIIIVTRPPVSLPIIIIVVSVGINKLEAVNVNVLPLTDNEPLPLAELVVTELVGILAGVKVNVDPLKLNEPPPLGVPAVLIVYVGTVGITGGVNVNTPEL